MGHEIGQYDIPERLLRISNAQSKVIIGKDIGEAKVTLTIFGRAKVRVIRERDTKRRTWLLVILAMAIAAAAWQWWISFQQIQTPPPLALSEKVRVSAPVSQPEPIAPVPPSVSRKSKSLIQTEIESLVEPRLKRPPPVLNATALDAKPVTAEPLKASKPQAQPGTTVNSTSLNQADKQQPEKLMFPIQPVAPTVSTSSATQPVGNPPKAVAPPAVLTSKEHPSTPSPAGDNQPSAPVKAQP
jgi:cytoskeletal protein RodZ